MEYTVNKAAFEALPKDLQAIVKVASRAANQDMLDEYTSRNNKALKELINKHGVDVRAYPDDVLQKLKGLSYEVLEELAAKDPMSKKVYESFKAYRDNVVEYHKISEQAYLNARSQP